MNPGNGLTASTNNYKYNGKEKQVELSLDQLDYGARFYDAEIARFNVIERFAEKYYSMTPYQYGGLDPIKHIDINGDSLYVTHRTGFLGLGGKQTLRYEGGNLYNQDGSSYTGKVKGFLKQTVNALGSINATQEGASLLGGLESSANSFTIVKSSSNSFRPDNALSSFANIPEVQAVSGNTAGSTGSGGTINFNPSLGTGGFNTQGTRDRPAYIALGHKLIHGRDANNGVLYPSQSHTSATGAVYQSDQQGLLKVEWRAVYYENIMRGQAGVPLRTHYGVQATQNGFQPMGPRLIDVNGRPINYQVR
ncbi:M91 family zinc metallopeptidase [Sphingobacterium hotanense]|nr:M91 family zinc metallopeptidase [Sphingobacterium hotanense]